MNASVLPPPSRDQESSLVAHGTSGALAVARRSPRLMAAYLAHLVSDPGLRAAFEAHEISPQELSELELLLSAAAGGEAPFEGRDGMEELWESLEVQRRLAPEGSARP